jgi:ATP-dependent DNA ligase
MLTPPIEPMLAAPGGFSVPADLSGLVAEPKWDGFRCLVFVSEAGVVLQGRGRSAGSSEVVDLAYAFPEVVAEVVAQIPPGTVVDAEIVIADAGALSFPLLTSRLRPRSEAGGANIARLAEEHPASLLAFDLLWHGGDLMAEPFAARRRALERLSAGWRPPLLLTPQTDDPAIAERWFTEFESAGVDGLILKPTADPYLPGKRSQAKVKHQRTADVVVAGWRPHKSPGADGREVVGSLLLGLHDDVGQLHYVGAASAFPAATRHSLVDLLAPHAASEGEDHPWRGRPQARIPGEASRWKKEQPWHALRPDRVAEVTYDQMEGDRFRHVAGFLRWRPDRAPASCTFDQVAAPPPADIARLLTS